jgi:hypothetical protein
VVLELGLAAWVPVLLLLLVEMRGDQQRAGARLLGVCGMTA